MSRATAKLAACLLLLASLAAGAGCARTIYMEERTPPGHVPPPRTAPASPQEAPGPRMN